MGQLATIVTNDASLSHQVAHQLRLVGRERTGWVENGANTRTALLALTDASDTIMDEARDLRDQNGADTVSLVFVALDPCGKGWVGGTRDDGSGLRVDHWNCIDAAGGWTLSHEVRHNLGSGHDVASPDGPVFDHALGYQIVGDTGTWTRIMARRAVVGQRIGFFSDPNVAFDHVGDEFGMSTSPFDTLSEAVDSVVYGGGVLVIGGGEASETISFGSAKVYTVRCDAL